MDKRSLISLCVSLVLVVGCATGVGTFDNQSTSDNILKANDPVWRLLCQQYAGPKREFQPDKVAGLRTYNSVCGRSCAQALADGYDFVDVVWLDFIWQDAALQTQPKRIERYRRTARFDASCITDKISSTRYKKCFLSERRDKPQGQTELVYVSAQLKGAFIDESRSIALTPRSYSAAQIKGSFQGYRDVSTGKLSGYGSFYLRGSADKKGRREVLARCPDTESSPVKTCANAQTCQLPQPRP